MTPSDQNVVDQWAGRVTAPVRIALQLTADDRSAAFAAFADELTRRAPNVTVAANRVTEAQPPAFFLFGNQRFQMIPADRELPVFLEAIEAAGRAPALRPVEHKAESACLQVFVSPRCPHCPQTVRGLSAAVGGLEGIDLVIIDAELFADTAAQSDIRSVPTVILNDHYRWSGEVDVDDILQLACHPDLGSAPPAALKAVLSSGKAAEISDMCLSNGRISATIVELLVHEKWPVRLGAMVVMESVAEADPALSLTVVEPLWRRFTSAIPPVRIDILHLMGELSAVDALERISAVADDPEQDPEVCQTAAEVAETLKAATIA